MTSTIITESVFSLDDHYQNSVMVLFSRPSEWKYLEGTCHELGHTWRTACVPTILEVTAIVSYEGFKIYLPLYLLSVVFRGQSLRQLPRVLPHVLRSSLFLGSNIGIALLFICLFRRLIGRFYFYPSVLLPGILGTGCALMVERPARRPLLAGYVATIAMELMYSVLKQRKVISGLPYGEVAMFATASAILIHRHRNHIGGEDLVNSILRVLLYPRLPSLVKSSFASTFLDNRLMHILVAGLWAFALGYFLQTLLSLFSQRTGLFKGRDKIKGAFASTNSIKFAAFLSSLVAGYKLINSLLYYLPLPRDIRLLLAGLVAGLSMLLYRSSSLSLYIAWKALEVLYSRGVDKGWLRYLPYGEVIIYALATGWLFHGWFYEGHNMRWTYWHFLRRITWGRIMLINFNALDKFGTGSSARYKEWTNRRSSNDS